MLELSKSLLDGGWIGASAGCMTQAAAAAVAAASTAPIQIQYFVFMCAPDGSSLNFATDDAVL
jgi:hypothetical protein